MTLPCSVTETPETDMRVALTDYEIQVLIGTTVSGRNMPPDDTFNLPAAWKNLHKLGLIDRADGLAIATKAGSAIVERIRSTLADPIPEAPADEEVASVIAAEVMGNDHLRHLLDEQQCEEVHGDVQEIVLRALRRSTETDKPGVRGALTLGLEAAAKWHDAEAERIRVLALDSDEPRRMHDAQDDHISHVAAIRALSASPLTEEQPAAKFKRGDRVQKIKGSAWRGHVVGTYSTSLTPEGYNVESESEPGSVQLYPAAALETLPRSTTGGAK